MALSSEAQQALDALIEKVEYNPTDVYALRWLALVMMSHFDALN